MCLPAVVIHIGVCWIVATASGLVRSQLQITTVGEHLAQDGPHLVLLHTSDPLAEKPDNVLLVIVPQLRLLSLSLQYTSFKY